MKNRELLCIGLLLTFFVYLGCASLSSGIRKAQEALPIIDSFYQQVLQKKANPAYLTAATIILQQADVIAGEAAKGKDTETMIAQARLLKAQADKLVGK